MQTHHSSNNVIYPQCWQYKIKQKNLATDLKLAGITAARAQELRVGDFKFRYVPKENRPLCAKIKDFIVRHEWLGIMPHRPTHRFIATYHGHLAGVIIMATPNNFSHLLGRENRDREKLISRGACISWAPKNLPSALIMYSIRWMTQNTPYRFFTGYSDTTAGEIGTIYQACNFIYLGQKSGARYKYFDPQEPQKGWFSDRNFRKLTSFKLYAREAGINWRSGWNSKDKIHWEQIPPFIVARLKKSLQARQKRCHRKKIPRKHKYVYIRGKNKRETKELRRLFWTLNPDKKDLAYLKRCA